MGGKKKSGGGITPFKETDHFFDKLMQDCGDEEEQDDRESAAKAPDFEKILIEDDRGELRIQDKSSMSSSNLSEAPMPMTPVHVQPGTVEHDRFIPQRNGSGNNAMSCFNFEAKEFLFAQKHFNCTHSANEQCDCQS